MWNYKPGEVLLLSFPFADGVSSKRRPALVLLDTGDEDIIVARITSQSTKMIFDVELTEWEKAGLRLPSFVRVNKVATLEKKLVERKLGEIPTDDWAKVRNKIQQLWTSI
jgi:mRNA interferase MazF